MIDSFTIQKATFITNSIKHQIIFDVCLCNYITIIIHSLCSYDSQLQNSTLHYITPIEYIMLLISRSKFDDVIYTLQVCEI